MKYKIKNYLTMIQSSMIFSTISFYYECCKLGRKEGVSWETTQNQGDSSFPDTCHVFVCMTTNREILALLMMKTFYLFNFKLNLSMY